MRGFPACLHLIAVGAVFAAVTSCQALDGDPFSALPPSCAAQARAQYHIDRTTGEQTEPQSYDDADSSVVKSIRAFEDKLAGSTFNASGLLGAATDRRHPPRLSRRDFIAAQHLFDDLPEDHFIVDRLFFEKWSPIPETEFHYKCLTDTCPFGTECTLVDLRVAVEGLRKDLQMNRRIVERITNWAKGVTQFNREASHLERKYDISESDILRSINHLPPQVAIITVRVPGKKPHLPLTESEQQGADPTPEAQS